MIRLPDSRMLRVLDHDYGGPLSATMLLPHNVAAHQ
jgi:hypothetical protein